MHIQSVLLTCLAAASSVTAAATPRAQSPAQANIAQLQANYSKNLDAELAQSRGRGFCNSTNIVVRKSWSGMTTQEKTNYLAAVRCLAALPTTLDPSVVPGARNRLDDFTWSHVNQTNYIHASGLLLPWHRQYVWAYEQALRNQCGYTGGQPYWDWTENTDDPSQSPLFDGSATSFGSNGKYIPHNATNSTQPGLPVPFYIFREPGTGGGCVTSTGGLGKNFTIELGPVSPPDPKVNTPNNIYGNHYNPRCLKRDFLLSEWSQHLSADNVSTLLNSPSIHVFRPSVDGNMHPASHSAVGGDLFDLFTSPTDPVFYLLHGQIDRLWTIWQGQDFPGRTLGLDGTVTFANDPPSANATLSTIMTMGKAGGNIPVGQVMSSYRGNYCYRYE